MTKSATKIATLRCHSLQFSFAKLYANTAKLPYSYGYLQRTEI